MHMHMDTRQICSRLSPSAVDCGTLEAPADGSVVFDATVFGNVATYSCSEDFALVGGANRTCNASGEWSGNPPTCEGKCNYFFPLME